MNVINEIRLKNLTPRVLPLNVTEGHRTDMDPSATYDFRTVMGQSLTISELNGDFSRKSQIIPTLVYLTPPR